MRIRLLHPYLNRERGDVVEYPTGVADALIQSHRAVAVVDEPEPQQTKRIASPPRNKAMKVSMSERK